MNGSFKKTALLLVFFAAMCGQNAPIYSQVSSPKNAVSKVRSFIKKGMATAVGLPLLLATPINGVLRVMLSDEAMFPKIYAAVKNSANSIGKSEIPFLNQFSEKLVDLNPMNRDQIYKQWLTNATASFCLTIPASIIGAILLYKTWGTRSDKQLRSRKEKEDLQAAAFARLMQLIEQVESTDKATAKELKTIVDDAKQLLASIAISAERAEFAAQNVEALVKQIESTDAVKAKNNFSSMKAYKDAKRRQAETEQLAVVTVSAVSFLIAIALIVSSR